MALPGSGKISLSDIAIELGLSTSNISLRNMSASATPSKSQPDAISEFYGYPPDSISLSSSYVVFNQNGGIVSGNNQIIVTSSGAWTSSITYDSGSGWLTVSPSSGNNAQQVTFSVTNYIDYRDATVTFTCGTASAIFSVSQIQV